MSSKAQNPCVARKAFCPRTWPSPQENPRDCPATQFKSTPPIFPRKPNQSADLQDTTLQLTGRQWMSIASLFGQARTSVSGRLKRLRVLVSRPLTLGVRGVVIDEEERILLVRHTYVSGWHFPGGGVEVGETLLEALARELEEEVGVRLEKRPALHGLFFKER